MTHASLEQLWTRQYSVFHITALMHALHQVCNALRAPTRTHIELRNGCSTIYASIGTADAITRHGASQLHRNPAYVDAMVSKLEESGRAFLATVGTQRNCHTATDRELTDLLTAFYKALVAHGRLLWESFYLIQAGEAIVKAKLSELSPTDIGQLIHTLQPSRRCGVMKALHEIRPMNLAQAARHLGTHYQWLTATDPIIPPSTDPMTAIRQSKRRSRKTKRVTALTKKYRAEVALLRKVLFLKDRRDEFRRRAFHASTLFPEIARRCGVSVEALAFCTLQNLVAAILHRRHLPSQQGREHASAEFVFTRTRPHVIFRRKSTSFQASAKTSFVAGEIGSAGTACGPARIVRSNRDLVHVRSGDILVALTTNTEYVPAMERAAAIVTDEGGITSHAAIVSRELGRPCVVGTHQATAVLRTGDRLSVHAEGDVGRVFKVARRDAKKEGGK